MTPNEALHAADPIGEGGANGTHRRCPIIGVGASAGGVEALTELFHDLPSDSGMAFVVVVHLDPQRESHLANVLSKATKMVIAEAHDGDELHADHVYVIPPNTTISISSGRLRTEPRAVGRGPHHPIDHFMRSLAVEREAGSIGVVLSGSGSDGAQGLAEIKAVGGITFVQEPSTAKYGDMPLAAIANGAVDFVLAVPDIAREIKRLDGHPYLSDPAAVDRVASDESSYQRIGSLVRTRFGVDLNQYRPTTIRRRILRRMALQRIEELEDYAELLTQQQSEALALYEDLMINVTSFFRDPELFEVLKTSVFPQLAAQKTSTDRTRDTIRVWVVGCSTGQEAYSLAMALTEFLDDKLVAPGIQIFATDINETTSLAKARNGLYPVSIEDEVGPERLRRFFKREEGGYRIHKSIRDLCVFAKQNVMADPPFSKLDMITCRNVLIYLSASTQRVVIPTFHYALAPYGYLVLGASETVGSSSDLFTIVDRRHKIFAKNVTALRHYPHFNHVPERRSEPDVVSGKRPHGIAPDAGDWQREADRVVMGSYVPAGVLVNDNLEILQFRGRTGAYFEPHPGEASLNLMRLVREGLFLRLKEALDEARVTHAAARREGVVLWEEGTSREIDIEVMPLKLPSSSTQAFLVLFEESSMRRRSSRRSKPASSGGWIRGLFGSRAHGVTVDEQDVTILRQELAATREYLQSIVEQREASNEELKSANEEILSSNEELQSTNEELQTAKEELQSLNEELSTVNEQLHHRNLELNQTNNDLSNLLTSSNIPIVMVGTDFRVRRFNAWAGKVLNLLPSDVGRPLNQIQPTVELPGLQRMMGDVIDNVRTEEAEVRDAQGHWYMLRVHPYRTADNKIDGAVVVLLDIHQMKTAQREFQLAKEFTEGIVKTMREPLLVLDSDLRVQLANRAYLELFKTSPAEVEQRLFLEIGNGQWNLPALHTFVQAVFAGTGTTSAIDIEHDFPGLGRRILSLTASRMSIAQGQDPQLLVAVEDVTDQRNKQRTLEEANRNKDEFLAILSHELRNPLAAIAGALQIARIPVQKGGRPEWAHDVIGRQVTHMTELINDLLDVARVSKGKIELHPQPIDLAALVKGAVEQVQEQVQRAGHELTVSIEPEIIPIAGDPMRLEQVVVNLLSNAIKYTDPGGHIRLELRSRANGTLIIVQDDGIGMPASLLAHLFEPFVQADNSLARSHGGLGLGLTVVQKIVALHGGTVTAESVGPGHGSTFSVRLPPADPALVIPPRRVGESNDGESSSGMVVLLAEDNEDMLRAMAFLLKQNGHEVLTASNGPDALELAVRRKPDVAVLDLGLPTMSGYTVAQKIRQGPDTGEMHLIALSGYGREEDRSRAHQAGFDRHFTKPVETGALLTAIADGRGKSQPAG